MDAERSIGRRLREVRAWRGLSLRAVAELAGMTAGHLSNIENGKRRVDKRSTLEALAAALRVAPSELAEQAFPAVDRMTSEAHAGISAVEAALGDYELGQDVGVAVRPWGEVAEELRRLNLDLRPRADYVAQGELVPRLIADLHASYQGDPDNRRSALEGLLYVYHTAAFLAKNLGVQGLPQLAAFHARRVAEELGEPQWVALAAWLRGSTVGGSGRSRQYELSVGAANNLAAFMNSPDVMQMYGMLHLNAAMATAAQAKPDQTRAHLEEAAGVAERLQEDVNGFGYLYFGRANVDVWRVSLGAELGDGGKVAEIARDAHPEVIPSAARQAAFYADLGRAIAGDRRTRPQAVQALVKAEGIAPQWTRNHPFVRETVIDLVRHARQDSIGRELRGLAYRMGLAA